MLIKDKSGEGYVLQAFLILIVSSVFFIIWVLALITSQTIYVDERAINTQIIIKKTLEGHCFSNEYGLFVDENMNQKNFSSCYEGFDDNVKFKLFLGSNSFTYPNEAEFDRLRNLCVFGSSNLCTQMKYPVRYLEETGESMQILTLQVISTT